MNTRRGRRVVCTVLAAGALAATFVAGPVDAAGAQPEGCEIWDPVTARCIKYVDTPPGPGGPGGPGGPSGPGIDAVAVCAEEAPGWRDCVIVVRATGQRPSQICGYVYHPDQSLLHYYHPDAPPDAILRFNICPRDGGDVYTEDTDWVPGGAAVPPSPAAVAGRALADLELHAPSLAADTACRPVAGGPWTCDPQIVEVPTFVQVVNWQGTFSDSACELGVCVSLTAVPTLHLDPGEPDSTPKACEPGGTRYDPAGGEPGAQATRPGACAWAYRHATAPGDGPEAWQGAVTITWDVSWAQTGGGGSASGTFDPFDLSTAFLRPIEEVAGLVTSAGA